MFALTMYLRDYARKLDCDEAIELGNVTPHYLIGSPGHFLLCWEIRSLNRSDAKSILIVNPMAWSGH